MVLFREKNTPGQMHKVARYPASELLVLPTTLGVGVFSDEWSEELGVYNQQLQRR